MELDATILTVVCIIFLYFSSSVVLLPEIITLSQSWSRIFLVILIILLSPVLVLIKFCAICCRDYNDTDYEYTRCCEKKTQEELPTVVIPLRQQKKQVRFDDNVYYNFYTNIPINCNSTVGIGRI